MERAVSKYAPYLYVLLRVVAGLLFACHGAQKLFGAFGGIGGQPGTSMPLFSLMGFAGCNEASPQQAAGYHKEGHCL
jgi:putative oxidoreductase